MYIRVIHIGVHVRVSWCSVGIFRMLHSHFHGCSRRATRRARVWADRPISALAADRHSESIDKSRAEQLPGDRKARRFFRSRSTEKRKVALAAVIAKCE